MIVLAHYFTLIIVILGTGLLGVTAGALGAFALLRQQSLLGDTIAHAALPGIALAFLITHSTNPLVLMIGGGIAGGIGTLALLTIKRVTTLKNDAILGTILSVFFGLGLVLMTVIQQQAIPHKSILSKFLFGSAATLLPQDILCMACTSLIIFSVLIGCWPTFKLITFDRAYARARGCPLNFFDCLLTALMVCAIVVGLQTVGVILMSSMLIAPAAAARQWTHHLSSMVIVSAAIGGFSGIVGTLISTTRTHLPTGPLIVIVMSCVVFLSLIAGRNGMLTRKKV